MPRKTSKKRRRPRGLGTVFFHAGRGKWVGRVIVGRTPTGKPLYAERWGLTQSEVVKKLAVAGPVDRDTLTLAAWSARWLESLHVRPATARNYRTNITTHVVPVLGPMRLADVNAGHVERLIKQLSGTLEPGTVNLVVSNMRTMFGAAIRAGLIVLNPAAIARRPRLTPAPVETFGPADLARIVEASVRPAAGGVIAAMAVTGMRGGEVLALDVEDWDRKKGTLSVTKTYHRDLGVGPPKSRHSRRVIRVPEILTPFLELAVGNRTSGPLFATEGGTRRSAQTVGRAWRRLLRGLELPYRRPHILRHSVATHLVGDGVPLGDVAKFVGDSVNTIVRVYVHAPGTDPSRALDRLYGGRKVGVVGQDVE